MLIRDFKMSDVPQIVPLMKQLGYPTTEAQFQQRMSTIQPLPNYQTIVAEEQNDIVGLLGLSLQHFYEHDGTFVQVGVFIVDEKFRGQGIGKQLLVTSEKWAEKQGARKILINSGNREERKNAHQIYSTLGYEAKSIGFVKDINNRG
ncbi:GNAT family N-acetyltransferase [Gracilibacillus salitolerans]|uniref:GNAT family N-acetyltransferase n=1 Tax=Gracilibacillus salitolerans TaxID=2663022 RepID=A0A5Q2TPD3_9BACI|nr:GNAT family N-acetyltransferase [Gracilibacillus salitolerans]QGH35690.1 GNAT family N-acetyltransferase [Gracilibacillus salitolerans]